MTIQVSPPGSEEEDSAADDGDAVTNSDGRDRVPSVAPALPPKPLARLRDTPKRRSLREAVAKTIGKSFNIKPSINRIYFEFCLQSR